MTALLLPYSTGVELFPHVINFIPTMYDLNIKHISVTERSRDGTIPTVLIYLKTDREIPRRDRRHSSQT